MQISPALEPELKFPLKSTVVLIKFFTRPALDRDLYQHTISLSEAIPLNNLIACLLARLHRFRKHAYGECSNNLERNTSEQEELQSEKEKIIVFYKMHEDCNLIEIFMNFL